MEFKYTVRGAQPTCMEPYVNPRAGESADDDFTFTCVCSDGYILSGAECVRETDCGCNMPDGYKPVSSNSGSRVDWPDLSNG